MKKIDGDVKIAVFFVEKFMINQKRLVWKDKAFVCNV